MLLNEIYTPSSQLLKYLKIRNLGWSCGRRDLDSGHLPPKPAQRSPNLGDFSSWACKIGLRVARISFKVYAASTLISHLGHLFFCSLFHLTRFFLWWQKIAGRTSSPVLPEGLPSHAQPPLSCCSQPPHHQPSDRVSPAPSKNPGTSPLVLKHGFLALGKSDSRDPPWNLGHIITSGDFNAAFYLTSHLQPTPVILVLFECLWVPVSWESC